MDTLDLTLEEIPDGGAKVFEVRPGLRIALFRVGGRVAAINNRCPHAGGSLGEGPFDGTMVKCPLHGFRVDVWRGIGNAGKPVQKFQVAVDGRRVSVLLPESSGTVDA